MTYACSPQVEEGKSALVRGAYDEARELFETALEIIQQEQPGSVSEAECLILLAQSSRLAGMYDELGRLYKRAFKICVSELGDDHQLTIAAVLGLAQVNSDTGNLAEAEAQCQKILKVLESIESLNSQLVVEVLITTASIELKQKQLLNAKASALAALRMIRGSNLQTCAQNGRALTVLAKVYAEEGNIDGAHVLLKRSRENLRACVGVDHPDWLSTIELYARIAEHHGQLLKAIDALKTGIKRGESSIGKMHPIVSALHERLAEYLVLMNQGAIAEEHALAAIGSMQVAFGSDSPNVAGSLFTLGDVYISGDRFHDAEKAYSRAAGLQERQLHPTSIELARTYFTLGWLYKKLNRPNRAQPYLRRALVIQEEKLGPYDLNTLTTKEHLQEIETAAQSVA